MARAIDADELIKHIKDLPTCWADAGGNYGPPMKYPDGLFYPEDIIASIENAPTLTLSNKWISVEKELPREKRMCLIYTPCDGFMCVGFYDGHDNWQNKDRWMIITALRSTRTLTKKVSHWMPLPEPPDWHLPEEENVE